MTKLVDQWGKPIIRENLQKELAAPQIAGVRQVVNRPSLTGLNPVKLARNMRAADQGDTDGYLCMAEEMEEKDAHYFSVMGTRKRSVCQMEITVKAASDSPADQKHAEAIRTFLNRDSLEEELFDLLDAIGKGYSAMEIIWPQQNQKLWLPSRLVYRPQQWFKLDRTDGETLLLHDGGMGIPLEPYKFIIHKHKGKSGLPIRGGVVRPCSWMFLFKNFSIKDWVVFLETYGQPMRIGKYHPNASDNEKDVLLRAVAQIGSDAAAIIPESMLIEFQESVNKSASVDAYEKMANFCDAQISKAVLGQTMTTDDGSSLSQAAVHNDVRMDIQHADAKLLAATLNEQLVKPIIDLNFGPQESYPKIVIGHPEDVDIEKIMNTADKAVRLGMKVSERGLREKVGLPEPQGDDDILRLAQKETPPVADEAPDAASQNKDHGFDVFDDYAEELAEEWEDITNPILQAIQKAADSSGSFEEFQQAMLDSIESIKMEAVATKLRDANFMANIAGQLDVKFKKGK